MHFGPDRKVKVRPLQETESEWQMASHRSSVFLVGDNAAGKDTVLNILTTLDKEIRQGLDCFGFNTLKVGHPTYNGLLSALKSGKTPNGTCVLTWYNSEIKACLGTKNTSIREEHLCQIAEGTEVGKRIQEEEICLLPNAWFVIGAQPEALHERMGGTVNGRLRAFCSFLDRRECTQVKFVRNFLKRKASYRYVREVLQDIACRQWKAEPDSTEHDYDAGMSGFLNQKTVFMNTFYSLFPLIFGFLLDRWFL